MPTFYDSQNQPLALGERLGSGGEGTVYSCDDYNLVAKIYHEPVSNEKAEKLVWMAAHRDESLLKVAAWVVDVLRDEPDGRVVGFVMPNIKAKEIHELYSLKSRRVYFPEATWQFLVHTAGNLARAFHNLHKNAHIMGDVNHGNCVVLADGTVKLIDCDSYSIKIGERRYPCEVGVATHLAPELQGADLSRIERENKHDNFGLAVIIFQLLFLGRHPFAGNYQGDEDKSIEECIRELRFAYGDGAEHRQVKQPPGTLALSAVSPRLALMFERAFLTEDRPEPREWIEALADLSENLDQCGLHPGHYYFNDLERCPWCEIEAQTGLMLFPFVTGGKHSDGEQPFNIFTVESLIASFGINENLPAKPLLPVILPPPAPEISEAKITGRNRLIVCASVQFFGLILLVVLFGAGIAFFIGMAVMMFWLVFWKGSTDDQRDDVIGELSAAQTEWEIFEEKWRRNALPQTLDNDLIGVRRKIADYQKFQQESVREAKVLQEETARRALFQHLRAMPLEKAEIEGFDEQERQWLVGKGIKTAAEITESRIRAFNDFNGAIVPKLLEWRNRIELDFNAAPHPKKIAAEQDEFARETARERRRIETEIEHSLTLLRSGAVNLRRQQQELTGKSTELADRFLQAKSNAESLGNNSAVAVVILVLITILTPYFGFIVSQINAPKADYDHTVSEKSLGGFPGSVTLPPPPPPKPMVEESDYDFQMEKNLQNYTNNQIASIAGSSREYYAERLSSRAIELTYGAEPDYENAERKMRLAIRLRENEPRFLNQLGYILYEQGEYKESLEFFNQSLKIDKSNTGTKTYIAISYLKMNRFADAKRILNEVVRQYPGSFEGFYNLGLANKELADDAAAIEAFRKAVKITPNDADANYELGLGYYRNGDEVGVRLQYEKLLRINLTKAKQLAAAVESLVKIGTAAQTY